MKAKKTIKRVIDVLMLAVMLLLMAIFLSTRPVMSLIAAANS